MEIRQAVSAVGFNIEKAVTFESADPHKIVSSNDRFEKENEGRTGAVKKWTILHYAPADNDLKENITADVNEMETVGSNDIFNILVQLDRGGENCGIYLIEPDSDQKKITSSQVKQLGRTNMADPDVLSGFIEYGMKNYPAQHYCLIISDHGLGWKGAIVDESHNGWMTLPQIHQALDQAEGKTGKRLDVIGFDACHMSALEVAYELKDHSSLLIGSQEMEGKDGWDYKAILSDDNIFETPLALVMGVVDKARSQEITAEDRKSGDYLATLSAVDQSRVSAVSSAIDELAGRILDIDGNEHTLNSLLIRSQKFVENHDIYHFAQNIVNSNKLEDEKLKQSAQKLVSAIERAVVAEYHTGKEYSNAHGLSSAITGKDFKSSKYFPSEYSDLSFSKDTRWDEAMEKIFRKVRGERKDS